jgi:iron(III) transport system permease protein
VVRSRRRPAPEETFGWSAPWRLIGFCAVVVGLIALPVIVTVNDALGADLAKVGNVLAPYDIRGRIANTLLVALGVTVACGVIGVGAAWLVERTTLRGKPFWMLLLVMPITIPIFVTSTAWGGLGAFWQDLAGAGAITAASYYPIVFLLTTASLRGMDPALEESARSLGLSPWSTFFRVVLPQLRPAIFGGLLIVALDTLVELDAFIAIQPSVFITDIYTLYRTSFSTAGPAVLSTLSILFCVAILGIERLLRGSAGYSRVSQGARRPPARYHLGRWAFVAVPALLAVAAVAVGIPVAALIDWAVHTTRSGLAAAAPGLADLPRAAATSAGLGVIAAVLGVVLALPIAFLATRYRGALVLLLERATFLSFALPDFVAAVALTTLAVTYLRIAYESVALLVFVNAILFVPIAVVALRVSLGQLEPRLEEVSRSLGLGPMRTLLRVTLPLLRPGLAAAGVLVFVFVLSDLTATDVLRPPGMITLGSGFSDNSQETALGAAAAYAAALMLLALISAYVLMTRFGRTRLREAA